MRPGDGEVPKMLARMYHRAGDPLKAIAELERHIEKNPGAWKLCPNTQHCRFLVC